jgi:signal transduction histidine kinase
MSQPENNLHPNPTIGPSMEKMLAGGGEMGELIRTMDWSKTSLGPISMWPQSLQTAVSICLFSRFPIHIWWGPELVEIYNDAYRPILGSSKHPASLGQPGAATSGDIWPVIGPMLRNVYENAVSTRSDNLPLLMERYGFLEETYFTLSYSPIFVETGGVGGIFTVITETTQQVLGERRLRTLYTLSERLSDARTAVEACQFAENVLAQNREDIPFALIYLLDESGTQAHLAGNAGVSTMTDLNPALIDLHEHSPWQLAQVQSSGQIERIAHLANYFTTLPPSPWEEHPHTALVLPIFASGGVRITGFLIGGISARLAMDEDYQHFYELIAGHIGTAIVNVRAYEEERQRADALAELDRAKTEFFSSVSHEFRTPLTLMLNPLQDLLSSNSGSLTSEQLQQLEVIQRNNLRLLKLVNRLLDFSRIQSNRIQASFAPSDLAALTTDLASNFRSVIERAGLKLIVNCSSLLEPVYVDQEMWEKIVLNLLSNAFKFTFAGEITVTLQAADDNAVLTVSDTGVGIAPDALGQIFDRFTRINGAPSRTHEGSGIGLALVKELVGFHRGRIEVTSALSSGTTFTVSIPFGTSHLPAEQIRTVHTRDITSSSALPYIQEATGWLNDEPVLETVIPLEADPHSQALGAIASPRTSMDARILVVDDNADMRGYLRRLLAKHYQVEVVPDGAAALKSVPQFMPDLVITDVMMPHVDGFELLQKLRENPKLRAIPLMLVSARAGEDARIEGLRAGADDYLVKPFSARELLARVEAQLQLAQLRQQIVRERLEAQTQYTQMLQRSNEELQQFAAVVSHDLQEPLRTITSYLRLIEQRYVRLLDAEGQEFIQFVMDGALRMKTLITDLLTYARIDGSEEIFEEISVQSVLDRALADLRDKIEASHAVITQETMPHVKADVFQLTQVFQNLISNAIKFQKDRVPNVRIGAELKGNEWEFSVRDNGIGIAPRDLGRIFEIFKRLHSADAYPGTGIGLAICKKVVERHRGQIRVISIEGEGTTFYFTLPA